MMVARLVLSLLIGASSFLCLALEPECKVRDDDCSTTITPDGEPDNDSSCSSHDDRSLLSVDLNETKPQASPKEVDSSDSVEWMSDKCGLVLAPSSLNAGKNENENDDNEKKTVIVGWGVFSLLDKVRGEAVAPGDVVVQVHDLSPTAWSAKLLVQSYWWEGAETGGMYEGMRVVSHVPGLGMLANGLLPTTTTTTTSTPTATATATTMRGNNVLSFVPRIDEGGLTRSESPGAGAITHYHNYTWFVLHNVTAGDELFVNYGNDWFQERKQQQQKKEAWTTHLPPRTKNEPQPRPQPGHVPVPQLRATGRCLDGLKAGRSSLPHAGRGAFAQWAVPRNKIVVAVPVIPMAKNDLRVLRQKQQPQQQGKNNDDDSNPFVGWQLLLNYVLGHEQSSTVLVPYGPLFSLVNHAPTTTTTAEETRKNSSKNPPLPTANVRLQWSQSTTLFPHKDWLTNKQSQLFGHNDDDNIDSSSSSLWMQNHSGLLLELVATRDLEPDEEVLLDYGPRWQAAWNEHVAQWKPPPDAQRYAPSYVHDDAIVQARTEEELKQHPYPEHVFTSCFYPIPNATLVRKQQNAQSASSSSSSSSSNEVTTVKWQLMRGMFEYNNLRPCRIVERQQAGLQQPSHKKKDNNKQWLYTVQILNRYGLRPHQRLSSPLIVTHVPRKAIRFSDKIYTTDQHLPNAFRHEIQLPDDVFPAAWKDYLLAESVSVQ